MNTFYIVVLPMLLEGEHLETGERHTFPDIAQDRINIWLSRGMVIVDPVQEPDSAPPAEPEPTPEGDE